jgi:hypothetical protein
MKNPVPAALISATLARRGTIDPDALLDCLSLVAVLDARCPGSYLRLPLTDRLITLKELRKVWLCPGWEAIQRMNALQATQLADTTYHPAHCGLAYWVVHRVGPNE